MCEPHPKMEGCSVIDFIDIKDLAKIIAGLVENGLTFEASPKGDYWIIILKGGY